MADTVSVSAAPWPDNGYRHLRVSDRDHLELTDTFLKALWSRTELAPIEESCDAERRLHGRLMLDPRRPVAERELAALADGDAQDNYRTALAFRSLLMAQPDLERAYLKLVQPGPTPTAAPLLDLLTQILVRHLVERHGDPFLNRAGELFFRTQMAALGNGVQLADAEAIARVRTPGAVRVLDMLIQQASIGSTPQTDGLDVLTDSSARSYFTRREPFDMVLDLALGGPGMAALEKLLVLWVEHFTGAQVSVRAVTRIDDSDWRWHIGLDPESNRILNGLYRGRETDPETLERIVALFSMEIGAPGFRDPSLRDHPVHLAMAVDSGGMLRVKPQNLLVNLPELNRI
jgi:hypothetical protein